MTKLALTKSSTVKLKVNILSPFHIGGLESWDRFNSFINTNSKKLEILKDDWLFSLGEKDLNSLKNLITQVREGNFQEIERLKSVTLRGIGYTIEKQISIGQQAMNSLVQIGKKNNKGEIQCFIRSKLSGSIYLPGSTIKGLLKSILLDYKSKSIQNSKEIKTKYEELKLYSKKIDDQFTSLLVSDISLKHLEHKLQVQEIKSLGKPKKLGGASRGVPSLIEVLTDGEFEISITQLGIDSDINLLGELKSSLEYYSTNLLTIEENILDNIQSNSMFIEVLEDSYNKGSYPVKLWKHKKSFSYRPYWEEEISNLNKIKGKEWLDSSRRNGIGDKLLYFSESKSPLGWVGITILPN